MQCFLGRTNWRLGLGTYQLGGKTEDTVKAALKIGYRHIDTAALYKNEAAVASAIAASGVRRSDICIATKIHMRDIRHLTIRDATERALKHLGHIDLLMLHNWHSNAPEAWALLIDELKAGRVGSIGVSNFCASDLAQLPRPLPAVNQIELSPYNRRDYLRNACSDLNISVAAHSPLAKARRLKDLSEIADPWTPAQLMIAWSLKHAACSLPRSSNPRHLKQNFDAQHIDLRQEQYDALQALEDGFVTHPSILR